MKDVDDTLAETIDDEDLDEDEADEDAEPTASDLEDADAPASSDGGDDVESIQELLTKQEAGEEADEDGDGDDTPPPAPAPRGDTAEAADNRVVPMQSSEFQCTNCFLVKHRSQLADPKKMRCRDCA